jgi:hypothetical protein
MKSRIALAGPVCFFMEWLKKVWDEALEASPVIKHRIIPEDSLKPRVRPVYFFGILDRNWGLAGLDRGLSFGSLRLRNLPFTFRLYFISRLLSQRPKSQILNPSTLIRLTY